MFAGIASVMLNEEGTIINGIASREGKYFFSNNLIYIRIIKNICFPQKIGEEVIFDKPVSTIEHPRINEWLSEVERQMRLTLANNLAKAIKHAKTFRDGQVEADPFVQWVDSFQVQIVGKL